MDAQNLESGPKIISPESKSYDLEKIVTSKGKKLFSVSIIQQLCLHIQSEVEN